MTLHLLKGCGLPNVYLRGGVEVEGVGEEQTTAYAAVDQLYHALARALAKSAHVLTAAELRFLRKRLGMSQGDLAKRFGKTDQAIAKWEKAVLPVPAAEGRLLRIYWLSEHSPNDLARTVREFTRLSDWMPAPERYVFWYDGRRWHHENELRPALATTSGIVVSHSPGSAGVGCDVITADVLLDFGDWLTAGGHTIVAVSAGNSARNYNYLATSEGITATASTDSVTTFFGSFETEPPHLVQ